jgi:hypothetical protein
MQELLRFIEIALPEVASKLRSLNVDPSVFASQWFITLFSYSMPFALVARIWDLFFLKRWSVAFRVSVALLQLVEKDLLDAEDMEKVVHVLKSIPGRLSTLAEMNAIVERAMRLNLDEDDARVLGNVPSLDFETTDMLVDD